MKILNLTQHAPTPEQVAAGVVEPEEGKKKIQRLLTFEDLPTAEEIQERAEALARVAEVLTKEYGHDSVMIGGAPYLMSALEKALKERGIKPLYAFSKREVVEETLPDGSVKKTQVFKHQGFVEVDDEYEYSSCIDCPLSYETGDLPTREVCEACRRYE